MSIELVLSYMGGEARRMNCEFNSQDLNGLPIKMHDCTTGTDYYYPNFSAMVEGWDFPAMVN